MSHTGAQSVSNNLSFQASSFIHNTNHKDVSLWEMLYKMLLSVVVVSIITNVCNHMTEYIPKMEHLFKKYCHCRNTNIQSVNLVSRKWFTGWGKYKNDITDEKLAILDYIHCHVSEFKEIHRVEQDYTNLYNSVSDTESFSNYYNIKQEEPIIIYRKKKKFIRAIFDNFFDEQCNDKKNMDDFSQKKKIIVNRLVLETNSNLQFIFDFIETTTQKWKNRLNNSTTRYIYTYLGEDADKNPTFDEEEFYPYSDFKGLVGTQIREIEKSLDFFISEVGKKWYQTRNLPYQLTLLLHGLPGTGKSCLASAIAKKYSLHVVRIKLSSIKTNTQFIKAFKNRNFRNRTLDYQDILYLFDEFDTENNEIVKERNAAPVPDLLGIIENMDLNDLQKSWKQGDKSKNFLKKYIMEKQMMGPYIGLHETIDQLSLGTILEEMNGINQMYGRKMILITNYPEKLDSALLRPGRIDHNVKLGYCTPGEIIGLIKIFFPNSKINKKTVSSLVNFTPADISNICKFSKNVDEALEKINKNE